MNTFTTLLVLNAGGIIAAIIGILFGLGGAIFCIKMVASSNTPRERKPWWGGGIVAGLQLCPCDSRAAGHGHGSFATEASLSVGDAPHGHDVRRNRLFLATLAPAAQPARG